MAVETYVIYHKATYRLYKGRSYDAKRYINEIAAKAQFTRLTRLGKLKEGEWAITSYTKFLEMEPEVEVINLLSGKPCKIKATLAGGCCDPSTETYHCM